MTKFEQQMNSIVPKMLRRFGPDSAIGSSIPNGPGSMDKPLDGQCGNLFRVFMKYRNSSDFWLGGGDTPINAWKDAKVRWKGYVYRKQTRGLQKRGQPRNRVQAQ